MSLFGKVCLSAFLAALWAGTAVAQTNDTAARELLVKAILAEGDAQAQFIIALADTGAPIVQDALNGWRRGEVFVHPAPDGSKIPFMLGEEKNEQGQTRALRLIDGQPVTNSDGQPLSFFTSELTAVETTSKLRKAIKTTLDLLSLADPDPQTRRSAVMKLGMLQRAEYLPILEARSQKEKNSKVRSAIGEALAITRLGDADPAIRAAAAIELGRLNSISARDLLTRLAADANEKPEVTAAAASSVERIATYIWWVDLYGTLFRGLSLGSILLVVALGLAITFGLMGVINMAHGEIMVIGGYAVYVVQNLFVKWFGYEGLGFQLYFVVALPIAFLSAALVGLLLERTIIQFLYKRPLESLLATWGVSLVLQQIYRLTFGAANVQVNSPAWLLGNFTINDVVLGYNRLFVIGFAVLIVIMTWLLLTKTSLGLFIRAVMQNRQMAACMGVRTARVNMMTFAFGSGLAGLAGAFLSQIGNVGPSLGQSYIVDSFMVVVVGGVGNLIGTIVSALSIGVVDQTLQPFVGPVMGKITVLAAIILFLQWKPGGLFPTRSRSLDG